VTRRAVSDTRPGSAYAPGTTCRILSRAGARVKHASSHRPQDSAALDRDELILALQARERFLDTILGGLETFVAVDADWRITFANSAAAELVQSPPDEIVGGDLWELLPAVRHEETAAQLRRAMAERVSAEYEVAGPEGRTYLGRAYPLDDGGLAISVRDVTAEKRRERERDDLFAALRRSEQSFEAVFESSPFAMSLTEMPSGTITRVNSAFERLFGFSREELVGKASPELGISDLASQADIARRFAEEGVLREVEVSRKTRAGEVMTLSINLDWISIGQRKFVLTSIRDVTRRALNQVELQRSREALQASERRYRSIVETTGDGIMIGEPDGSIVFVNQRMADMLGYERDELVGMRGLDLVFPDWKPAVLDNRVALGEGEVVRGEFKLRRKDGTPIWTVFSSTPMLDAARRHTGNLTMHSDITELKAAEEALRRSEERFRLVLGAAPVSVSAQDKDLRFVWAFNQRSAPSDDVVGRTDADLFTPEEAVRLQAIKRRVLEEGVEIREQMWLERPGGRMFLDCTFMPLLDESGEVTGVGVTTVDLTPMRLADEARRQTEQTLHSFYDSAPFLMGVGQLDGDQTVVLSANRAMGKAVGADPGAIAGRRGVDIGNPPEFEKALCDAYREAERTRRPVSFEQAMSNADGEVVLNVTVAHIGADSDGEPLFSFIAEDVTERRRTQKILLERELAAAAEEERSRLARDLHDSVTQALFAASLKAEALATADDVAPETARAVEDVRRLTGGALAQMRTMLLELRGESLDKIPIRQLLRNVVEATESRTQTVVELSIEGADILPPSLHVAVYRIAQEALNNVARHARAEHARVELHTGASRVRLSVSDDGQGFEPGPQGPAHLGLRSMQERAAEAGADLRVESAPGRGASIILEWRPPAS
jgi:PAS domain S-box-containing protein